MWYYAASTDLRKISWGTKTVCNSNYTYQNSVRLIINRESNHCCKALLASTYVVCTKQANVYIVRVGVYQIAVSHASTLNTWTEMFKLNVAQAEHIGTSVEVSNDWLLESELFAMHICHRWTVSHSSVQADELSLACSIETLWTFSTNIRLRAFMSLDVLF